MEHIDTLFGIVLPYANFFLFLALAVYFFKNPARKAALAKKESYEKLLQEARQAKDAAMAKLDELKRREAQLASEIADLRTVSETAGRHEADKIIADGERLAQHLRTEARRIATAEIERAKETLRDEIVATVRDAVAKRISTETSPETQQTLVRNRIENLKNLQADL